MQLAACISQYEKFLEEWLRSGMIGKWVAIPFDNMERPIFASSEEEIWRLVSSADSDAVVLVREIARQRPVIHLR